MVKQSIRIHFDRKGGEEGGEKEVEKENVTLFLPKDKTYLVEGTFHVPSRTVTHSRTVSSYTTVYHVKPS